MKSKFLIIGFTGPIGSGCTEIASFLEKGIGPYREKANDKEKNLTTSINSHYRFLKEMQIRGADDNFKYKESACDDLLNPDTYYKKTIQREDEAKSESRSKIVNRKLRGLLIKRKVLNYLSKSDWNDFTYISMSSMLMKIIVEMACNGDGTKKEDFDKHSKNISLAGKERISKFSIDHLSKLSEFNEIIESKEYKKLDEEFCREIDHIIVKLKLLKKELLDNNEIELEWLQDVGDNTRATGNPYIEHSGNYKDEKFEHLDALSCEANKLIKYFRRRCDGKNSNYFTIDSFRNPAEVKFFRSRYGSFYLCSIYANLETRKAKLGSRFVAKVEKRDQGKYSSTHELYKQNVPSCTLISDYAISNEQDQEHFQYNIVRLLCLIDNPGFIPPSTDEVFMNFAYSLSLRSTCLSRQVGAVITNEDGFVVAGGWNDVGSGQMGCSLNCVSDFEKYSDPEYLLSNWKERVEDFKGKKLLDDLDGHDFFCFKDLQSSAYLSNKLDKTYQKVEKDTTIPDNEKEVFKKAFSYLKKNLTIKRLEYARSLHAEENAILQAARFGGMGISGGTIYTTTYPCELCSKKIYQSQLKRIVYTEPYPDSLSEQIFLKDGVRQIGIDQFEGVKSPSFHRLFKSPFDIKEYQAIEDML